MLKRTVAFLLVAVTLISVLASCQSNGNQAGEGESEAVTERVGPYLVINGVDISEFVILKEHEDLNMNYQKINSAIYSFCRERLTVKGESDSEHLIRIVEDFSLMPNEYCVKVENGQLQIGVFNASFKEAAIAAVEMLKEKLTGEEVLCWNNGYYEKGSYELTPVAYTDLKSTDRILVYGGTDKDALSYTQDDQIIFRVACVSGEKLVSVPYFKYEIYNETTGKWEYGGVEGTSGVATIPVEATGKTGVVYIEVTACDQSYNKITKNISTIDDYHFRGSAVVNMRDINMLVDVPSDFDSFWQAQKDALYSKDIQILKMVEKSSTKSGFKLFYVELGCNVYNGETDGIVSGYLTYPTSASATSQIDLRVVFKGYSFSASEPSYQAGTATFSVCAHSVDCESANADTTFNNLSKKDPIFNKTSNSDRETAYFRGMILRDVQAARFMVEYFGEKGIGNGKCKGWWNGTKFTATGGSQGAFQSIAVAALDKNITDLDISIPWMCDIKATNGRKKSSFIMTYTNALEYYDTTSFAHLITCKVKVSASLGDGICPISGVVAFYNALNCEKVMICTQNASHSAWLQPTDYKVVG